jgi:hypothetical protein
MPEIGSPETGHCRANGLRLRALHTLTHPYRILTGLSSRWETELIAMTLADTVAGGLLRLTWIRTGHQCLRISEES